MTGSVETFLGFSGETNFKKIIEDLTKVEVRYSKKLIRWHQDWQKRLDAFAEIKAELGELRSTIGTMRSMDSFLAKNVTSSKPSVATATANGKNFDGTYNIEVGQVAKNSIWNLSTGISDKNASINDDNDNANFVYTYKNKSYSLKVPKGTSLEGLKNMINRQPGNPGVRANLVQSSSGVVFQIWGNDTGTDANLTIENSTNIPRLPVDTQKRWQSLYNSKNEQNFMLLDTPFASSDTVINSSGADQFFGFKINNTNYSVVVNDGMTVGQLKDKINTATGLETADIRGSNGIYYLVMQSPDTKPVLNLDGDVNDIISKEYDKSDEILNTSETENKKIVFHVDGEEKTIDLPPKATINTFVELMNKQYPGVASVARDSTTNKFKISINTTPSYPNSINVSNTTTVDVLKNPPATSKNWSIQEAQNALIRVNNTPPSPEWIEVASNTISDAVEGMTFTIFDTGTSSLVSQTDKKKIIENTQKFVDSINKVRKLILEQTKVDNTKTLASDKDATSQFEMEKGSLLTGNYGVQIISSELKQLIASQGIGFMGQSSYGSLEKFITAPDPFLSLAQIGITTNSKEGNPNFGMLEIKLTKDSSSDPNMTFLEALEQNPAAVAELFSAQDLGKSQTPNKMSYHSHIPRITKAGSYKVEYFVDANGVITDATINGKKATIDNQNRRIGLGGGDKNDADGLFVEIYDLTPTTPDNPNVGVVSIQEGKINQIINRLDGVEGFLGSKGTLGVLESNYKNIMRNVQAKIMAEDDRLDRWEKSIRLRFSRLEATLKYYNSVNEGLKAQVKGLEK